MSELSKIKVIHCGFKSTFLGNPVPRRSIRNACTLAFKVIDDTLIVTWAKPFQKVDQWSRQTGHELAVERINSMENINTYNKINKITNLDDIRYALIDHKIPGCVVDAINFNTMDKILKYYKNQNIKKVVIYGFHHMIDDMPKYELIDFESYHEVLSSEQSRLTEAQSAQLHRLQEKILRSTTVEGTDF